MSAGGLPPYHLVMPTTRTEPPQARDVPIPGVVFAGAAMASGEGFDAWCDSMRPVHDIRPAEGKRGERRVSSTGWVVDDLYFNELGLSPITYRRRARKAGDVLLVRFYWEGSSNGIFKDAPFRTRPGEIHLFDQAAECRGVAFGWNRMASVFLPYSTVRYEPRRHPGHVCVGPDDAPGRMLWSSMAAMFAELPRTSRAEASTLASAFAGLVASLLLAGDRSAASSRECETARRLAMRRYLDEHLSDPELGVASLCAAFGASRATIYRNFAEEGGVARFVARRRLDRAFRDLASLPPGRGRVRQVAERWGFACPYHFSRAFRRQFDLWPTEVFEASRSAEVRLPSAPTLAVPPGAGFRTGAPSGS